MGTGWNRSEFNKGQLDCLKINLIVQTCEDQDSATRTINRCARGLIYIYTYSFISLERNASPPHVISCVSLPENVTENVSRFKYDLYVK